MSRRMTEVKRYRCEWCGKEFRTPDRHHCRFDPDVKNCLSCEFVGTFIPEDRINELPCGFHCAATGYVQEGAVNDFPDAISSYARTDWEGKPCPCDCYRLMAGYAGKQSFRDRMVRLEAERKDYPTADGKPLKGEEE